MYDFYIIGAGLFGCTVAQQLAAKQKTVLLIEKEKNIGGLAYDYKYGGLYIHKFGPHVLNLNSPRIYSFLKNFTEFDDAIVKRKAYIDGRYVPLPINLNSLRLLNFDDFSIKHLLDFYGKDKIIYLNDLLSNTDFMIKKIGNVLYEKVYLGYNLKMWNVVPEEIDKSVVNRMPIILNNDSYEFQKKYILLPKFGYSEMFSKMIQSKYITLLNNTDWRKIFKFDGKRFICNGNDISSKIVYSAPIDELYNYKYGFLPYRSMNFSFFYGQKYLGVDASVITYPCNFKKTRTTNLSMLENIQTQKNVFVSEYPTSYCYSDKKSRPMYPVLNNKSELLLKKYLHEVSKVNNLYIGGRLAEFKYFDMEATILSALNIVKKI